MNKFQIKEIESFIKQIIESNDNKTYIKKIVKKLIPDITEFYLKEESKLMDRNHLNNSYFCQKLLPASNIVDKKVNNITLIDCIFSGLHLGDCKVENLIAFSSDVKMKNLLYNDYIKFLLEKISDIDYIEEILTDKYIQRQLSSNKNNNNNWQIILFLLLYKGELDDFNIKGVLNNKDVHEISTYEFKKILDNKYVKNILNDTNLQSHIKRRLYKGIFENLHKEAFNNNKLNLEYDIKITAKLKDFDRGILKECDKEYSYSKTIYKEIFGDLQSSAVGFDCSKTKIRNVYFKDTNLQAMYGKGIKIQGPLVFHNCVLNGSDLSDYEIQNNGELYILGISFSVNNLNFASKYKNKGKLHLEGLRINSSNFSIEGNQAFFSPTFLKDTWFENCNFEGVHITSSPASYTDLYYFYECNLYDSEFHNIKGAINFTYSELKTKISDSCINNFRIRTSKITDVVMLDLNNTKLESPDWENSTIEQMETWDSLKISVDKNKIGKIKNCILKNCDLSNTKLEINGKLDFTNTYFQSCNLSDINFQNCILDNTIFEDCIMDNSEFSKIISAKSITIKGEKTSLKDIIFKNLFSNITIKDIPSDEISSLAFKGIQIDRGTLLGLDFKKWDVSDTLFKGVIFDNCSFEDCNLNNTIFDSFNQVACKFNKVNFKKQKTIENVNFKDIECDKYTTFEQCFFKNTKIGVTYFFNNAKFNNASFEKCEWAEQENLSEFPLDKIDSISNTKFENCDFSGSKITCKLSNINFNTCKFVGTVFGKKTGTQILLNNLDFLFSEAVTLNLTFNNANIKNIRIIGEKSSQIQYNDISINNSIISKLSLDLKKINKFSIKSSSVNTLSLQSIFIDNFEISDSTLDEVKFSHLTILEKFTCNSVFNTNICFKYIKFTNAFLYDKNNILNLDASSFKNVDFIKSSFNNLALSNDFKDLNKSALRISESKFINCDFANSKICDFNFLNCNFDENCDFRGVNNKKIEGVQFNGSTLLAKLDGLELNSCNLKSTTLATKERKIRNVLFKYCIYDNKTSFKGITFIGGDDKPELFIGRNTSDDSLKQLILRYVNIYEMTLNDFYTEMGHNLNIKSSYLENCTFANKTSELKIEESELYSCIIKNMDLTNKNQQFYFNNCKIDSLLFNKCSITNKDFDNTDFRKLEFRNCEIINKISFNSCTFQEVISFISDVANEPLSKKTQEIKFDDCTVADNFKTTFYGYQDESFNGSSFNYRRSKAFEKKQRDILKKYGFESSYLSTNQGRILPFMGYNILIKELIENGEIGEIRHTSNILNADKKTLKKWANMFRDFKVSFKRNLLCDSENIDIIHRCTDDLIDKLKQISILREKKQEVVKEDPEKIIQLLHLWEENLLIRLNVDAFLTDNPHIDIRGLFNKVFPNLNIGNWPKSDNGKIYCDFIEFKKILNRINTNVLENCILPNSSLNGIINIENTEGIKTISLLISDTGDGLKINRNSAKEYINNSYLGKMICSFSKKYCKSTSFLTKNIDGEIIAFINKTGKFIYVQNMQKIAKGKTFGTAYIFKIRLF